MKQCIVVRKDLKMPPGKLSAQVSHASVEATLRSKPSTVEAWRAEGMKKVVLKVNSLEELVTLQKKAKALKLTTAMITDAGKTVFKGEATVTCLALGPDDDAQIDRVTGHLPML